MMEKFHYTSVSWSDLLSTLSRISYTVPDHLRDIIQMHLLDLVPELGYIIQMCLLDMVLRITSRCSWGTGNRHCPGLHKEKVMFLLPKVAFLCFAPAGLRGEWYLWRTHRRK